MGRASPLRTIDPATSETPEDLTCVPLPVHCEPVFGLRGWRRDAPQRSRLSRDGALSELRPGLGLQWSPDPYVFVVTPLCQC